MRLLITLLSIIIAAFVHAEERIHNYHSDIIIDSNGDMKVTETITVNAEGNKIKRGIYRDFPTKYKDRLGNNYNVGFSIDHVMRDDYTEDYHIKNMSNGVRIYLGNKDRYLKKGIYRYTISYRTNRQLGFFDKHDELYWNVTGTDWDFPIDKASATVRLPGNIPVDQISTEAYTGAHGSKGQDYKASIREDGAAYIETTRSLPRRHGLTIVISWPKGYVTAPTRSEQIEYLYQDNQYLFYATIGFLVLLIYYWLVWLKVGKDPEEGAIFPRYEPPSGFSPASMRFIEKMGYDKTCFAAAIINLAVKGYLKIEDDDNDYTLKRTGKNVEMAPGESALATNLFGYMDSIKLEQSNHAKIGKALDAHEASLERNYEKIYFLTNNAFFAAGILITFCVLLPTILLQLSVANLEIIFMAVWLTIWSFAVIALISNAYRAWRHAHNPSTISSAIFMTLFALPFLFFEIMVGHELVKATSLSLLFVIIFAVAINWIFYELLKAPTKAGRKLLDKIEGFKQYIDIAEKHELDYKHPKGRSPELFEEYLPYALALGIEQQWGEQFADVLTQASVAGSTYQPSWYHGSHWNHSDIGDFTSSLGSSFTSAIASSSTAPGSSSGGGGGGSSGGGGGGGGGGGW